MCVSVCVFMGGHSCMGQSSTQITDIFSVYLCTVHLCVFAAALLSVENFLSALRGKKGNGHFSSSLWGSSIFHNLFCLVTSCSQTLEMHCSCYITCKILTHSILHSSSMFRLMDYRYSVYIVCIYFDGFFRLKCNNFGDFNW